MGKGLKISEKQIIKISEFMANYIGKEYDGYDKLTHYNMKEYLYEKGIPVPRRAGFNDVTKEKLLTGEYIAVKDETNRVFVYQNPRKSLQRLEYEMRHPKTLENTKKARKAILDSYGLVDTSIGVLEKSMFEKEEYRIEKVNRNRQFVMGKRKIHY